MAMKLTPQEEYRTERFAGFIAAIIFAFAIPGLWYTFDDALASLVGNPPIGKLGYWNLFGFYWFASFIVSSARLHVRRIPKPHEKEAPHAH